MSMSVLIKMTIHRPVILVEKSRKFMYLCMVYRRSYIRKFDRTLMDGRFGKDVFSIFLYGRSLMLIKRLRTFEKKPYQMVLFLV
jgi:hypothetical protein